MTPLPKIRTITVDTLTGIQNEIYMQEQKKATHDKWKDYGQGIWKFISYLKNAGFHIILILGDPGTGKSSGMRTLHPKTNVWFNADNKYAVWKGGKNEYGTTAKPIAPYHIVPKTYQDIIKNIEDLGKKGAFEEERFAILTGHIEDYKSGNANKQRLKVLGNLATKMQLEGRLETVLYSEVIKEAGETRYVLTTENSGFNTARSPMDLFDSIIDNDYQFVIDKLLSY